MSEVSNPNLNVTRQDLADFYDKIFPYLGGRANAGFTPVGTVISVMGVTAPANYLACDGTVYNISDYPELAAYFGQQFSMINKFGGNGTTTFAVPNLQGEFLRGAGTNSHTNQGNGASVGSHQDATQIPAIGYNNTSSNHYFHVQRVTTDGWNGVGNQDSTVKKGTGNIAIQGTSTESTEGQAIVTTRPTNTSVLWCIATKNIYMNPSLDYSTDEKVVGSWIDGATIYQKTIESALPTISTDGTSANAYIDVTSLAIDKCVDIKGFLPTNGLMVNSAWDAGGTYNLRASFDKANGNRLVVSSNRSTLSQLAVILTIQYTKTT